MLTGFLRTVGVTSALLVFGSLLLSGCSGSSSNGSGGSTPTSSPAISLSTTALSFAATTVGQVSASQTVTVTNSGSATLTLSAATLSDTSDYAVMTTCGASLAVAANCTLTVQFKPQSAASLSATLALTDNAANSPQMIALSGTGTAAAVPQVALSPATGVAFSATAASSTTTAQTVLLTNGGNATLSITGIAIGGTNPSDFGETNTCGTSLASGLSCSIAVTFTPAAASTAYSATLVVTDNAGGVTGATQSVPLSGSGATPAPGPVVVLSTGSLTFAATAVGNSAGAQSVTLTNTGNAALTGIAVSLGGANASSFSFTTTCGSTLAAGLNCSIAVNFTPIAGGSLVASLSVSDNAAASPQAVSLSGTGTAPVASLSAASISFPTTKAATTSAPASVTLTNTGNTTLNIVSIVLGGTNAANFTESTTCGATVAAGASCNISATFTPTAQASYSATIAVTDNAAGSPQAIALSGSGTTSAVTYTLYTFPESDNSVTPLYALINSAQQTIDMTMYELQDTVFTGDLVAACSRGVKVRVVLSSSESSNNATAFSQLNSASANCSAVQSNTAFVNTHQKTFTIDGATTAIMSLNLQSQYYSTTRDFAMVENDPNDIAAIEATFNQDYAAGKPSGGTQGASDFNYQPGAGDDLIWSPTTAQADMLALINNATKSIVLENEEMSASNIVTALENACKRGVTVHIAMVADSSYDTNFAALEAAGCGVHLYPNTTNGFYIHAKAVVADYGLSMQAVYMGSINYSTASMTENRELGLYITDAASAQALYTTMSADYAGGTPY